MPKFLSYALEFFSEKSRAARSDMFVVASHSNGVPLLRSPHTLSPALIFRKSRVPEVLSIDVLLVFARIYSKEKVSSRLNVRFSRVRPGIVTLESHNPVAIFASYILAVVTLRVSGMS